MIEIIKPNGEVEAHEGHISFKEIQKLVEGFVQMVTITENGKVTQVCCNEDGLLMGLNRNVMAEGRFKRHINISQAVGTWVVLTGKSRIS